MSIRLLKWQRNRSPTVAAITLGAVLGLAILIASYLPVRLAILCLIGLVIPFIAILSGNVSRFVLSLLILDITLGLDIHLGYDPRLLADPNGVAFSLTTISLAVLYAIWFTQAVLLRKAKPRFFRQVSLPALCVIGTGLLSILNSTNAQFSFFEIVQLGEMFLVYFYVANHVQGEEDVRLIIKVLLLGLFVEAAIILLQYSSRAQFDLLLKHIEILGSGGRSLRAAGTFGEPNCAAGYLTPLLIICLGLLLSRTDIVRKSLIWLPFGLGLIALVVTLSRGGWLGFLVGVGILMVLNVRYRWLSVPLHTLLAAIVMAAVLAGLFGPAILARLSSHYDSALARIPLIQLSLNMIRAHPLIGIGINNFGLVMRTYLTADIAEAWLYIPHTRYMTIWAETGTLGLLAFLWFLASVFGEGFRCLRAGRPFFSPLALGIVAALSGYATHMLVDVFEARTLVLLLWTLAGLVVGMASMLPEARTRVAAR
jgi:putative inorganic carbon (HCO3(-)) transporter